VKTVSLRKLSPQMNGFLSLVAATFIAALSAPQNADAQDLLKKIQNISEQVDGGVIIDGLTPFQDFYSILEGALHDHGEPWPHARIHVEQLDHDDRVGFYFLVRMSTNRWLSPLLERRPELLENRYPCDDQEYRLQAYSLHAVDPTPWCIIEQWNAATWLLEQVNSGALQKDEEKMAQTFLLLHTAGGDLSPLEVKAALIGDAKLTPADLPERDVSPPNGARFDPQTHKTNDIFESWENWSKTRAPEINSHDIIFFEDQSLENNLRFLNRIPRIPGPYFDAAASHVQYMIGNSISFSGVFGRYNDEFVDVPGDPTFKLIVNDLHIDRSQSRNWHGAGEFKFGEINMSDLIEPPVLIFHGPRPVIFARRVTLGDRILKTPLRLWAWINESHFSEAHKGCPIDSTVRQYSLKQISKDNPFRRQYLSIDGVNCTSELLLLWQSVISWEIANRPQNIFHRYANVLTPSSGNDPFGAGFVGGFYTDEYHRSLPWDAPKFKKNYTQERVFISNDMDLAREFFGQSALESWGWR
jgi:hypothetical protein